MKELRTLSQGAPFQYEREASWIKIYYGSECKQKARISIKQFESLLEEFQGQSLPLTTTRNTTSNHSIGTWLKINVTKTAIASYIGAILIAENHATKIGSLIKFN